ncbi:MAG TPA: tetratricopeptide repeat protein [Kofleriaceae bacterium]|nr:tetratricopeptide repeat protein [Kofleriaceae bacterium]
MAGAGPKGQTPNPKGNPAPKEAPAPTGAPSVQSKADVLFEKGQANFQGGQFQAAIELFKQAYDLVRDPVYLFNIAQSYRKVGDCLAAFDYYNRYLGESPKAENRDKVNQWLREMQPCVEQRQKEQEAARRGEEAEQARQQELLRRQREAARPVEVEVDRGKPFRITGLALGGVGIVGLAVGITYGIKSKNIKNDVATQCANGCQWDSMPIQSLDADGRTANSRAKLGYIVGGIATAAGVGLYMFGRTRVETVMVTPSSGGASVSAQLAF